MRVPEISIIIPVYNAESSIKRMLDSIINQNFNEAYEIIIIDDGSTDNTEMICSEYANQYSFILYEKIKNAGVSNARNKGIEKSIGKYIMFADSDDAYKDKALENMYYAINSHNADLIIAGYERVNEISGKRVTILLNDNMTYKKTSFNYAIEKCQKRNLFNQVWNKIFISNIIKNNNIKFNTSVSLGEDYRFVLEYVKHSNSIEVINQSIYSYTNATNGLNCKYRSDRLDVNLDNMRLMEEYFKENKFDMGYIDEKYMITILSGLNNICNNSNKEEKNKELDKFIHNSFVYKKINNKINAKYTCIGSILKTKNKLILKALAKILNVYSKHQKVKLGY